MKASILKQAEKSRAEAPYSRIAPVYDHMMAHVDYEAWADYIAALLTRYGNGGHRLIDAGCGTGQILQILQKQRYQVFGVDLSFAMLDECRRRSIPNLWQGDIRNMALRQPVDAVICLYDTLQYLKPAEIGGFFDAVWGMLCPGGVLIFDVVTEKLLRDYWADYTEWDRVGDYEYTRRSWYDSDRRCQHTEIRIRNEATGQSSLERHRQWLFDLDAIPELAEKHRLSFAGQFEEFTFDPGDADSERIHFVFRRRTA